MDPPPSRPKLDRSLAYRKRWRERSHQDAMSEEDAHPSGVPDHPLIPSDAPALVTTAADLNELVDHLRSVGSFAYDTEFIGELSYHPRICLIQIATPERVALVDPLEDLDLTVLWEAIADPSLQTVVHAGGQDLEPVFRALQRSPANIFDTQITAGFAGQPYPVSLRNLVQELVGVNLGKGMTFTHWDHRPLSARHLRYAADDVRYLPAVKARIDERLESLEHTQWARQECAQLEDPGLYRFDVESQYSKVRGAQTLDARQLTVLRELVAVRDGLARQHDMPPRTLLKDEVLVRLIRDRARTLEKLRQIRGVPRPLIDQHGEEIIDAVARAMKLPPVSRPRFARIEETASDRVKIDGLLTAATSYCLGRSVDPGLVMNRSDIASFFRALGQDQTPDSCRLNAGWRGEFLGSVLDRFARGDASLCLRWSPQGLDVSAAEQGPRDVTS